MSKQPGGTALAAPPTTEETRPALASTIILPAATAKEVLGGFLAFGKVKKDIIRAVGVDTGGCNIQFAVDPASGRIIVIEMNPRVSRSSALASKATGFPIAKIAAKLAIGYRLDEIPNDITKVTPASFEPTLDYVVVKVPRFAFEKFPAADTTLTTTMKSVGEAMAIGRNYTTALQKALRSLEKRGSSFHWGDEARSKAELVEVSKTPTDGRIVVVQQALRAGATVPEMFEATGIDPWFLDQIVLINEVADLVRDAPELDAATLMLAKDHGFSDVQLGQLRGIPEVEVRGIRHALSIRPVYKTVITDVLWYRTIGEKVNKLVKPRCGKFFEWVINLSIISFCITYSCPSLPFFNHFRNDFRLILHVCVYSPRAVTFADFISGAKRHLMAEVTVK